MTLLQVVHEGLNRFREALPALPREASATAAPTAQSAPEPDPPKDFIEAYSDYADIIEAQRIMHSMVAMQIVAAVLNRNGVTIPLGAFSYSLDLWTVLLSGSGHGRSTLVGLATPILESADLATLVRGAEWGSEPAFMQDMADHPSGLFVWGELSKPLKQMNDPRFGAIKQWITDAYDSPKVPDERRYRKTGGRDTPSITFTAPPRTNILATSSEAWFFDNLETSDSAGGFIPRWLIVQASGSPKSVPIPERPDETRAAALSQRLLQIATLSGPANIERIQHLYEDWYRNTGERFRSQPNSELAMAFFNRHRGHVLKLAVIYEASVNNSLNISEQSWNRATATAAQLESTIFSMLNTGMNSSGYVRTKMEDFIRAGGTGGVSRSAVTRAFQHIPMPMREESLRTLLDTERIRPNSTSTSGRPATVYVHRDHIAGLLSS